MVGASQEQPGTEARLQEKINAYWDARGRSYDAQPGHGLRDEREHRAWLEALAALLPPPPCDVLDVGCGTGFLALLLAELGYCVVGVDLAEGMLAEAWRKVADVQTGAARLEFRLGDAVDPPLPTASVDVVISRHVLWTLPDLERAFASWRRLLRPGGRVVAIDALWKLPAASKDRDGTAQDGGSGKTSEDWHDAWAKHYSAEVQSRLPLFNAQTLDPAVAAAKAAGFRDVRVTGLDAVERVERELDEGGKTRQPRYVLTARLA